MIAKAGLPPAFFSYVSYNIRPQEFLASLISALKFSTVANSQYGVTGTDALIVG
jgi:hypothetical protein